MAKRNNKKISKKINNNMSFFDYSCYYSNKSNNKLQYGFKKML